jgi:predicted  nucleic acid-binding Zn-ribbon protein
MNATMPTHPDRKITLVEVMDAIAKRDAEAKTQLDTIISRLDDEKVLAAERHRTVVDKLNHLEKRVDNHESRIQRVENNVFPTLPLWSLVGVSGVIAALAAAALVIHH